MDLCFQGLNYFPLPQCHDGYGPSSVILPIDDYNQRISSIYSGFRSSPGAQIGYYSLTDISVNGDWGFVFDTHSKEIPVLQLGFGWNPDHLSSWCEQRQIKVYIGENPVRTENPIHPILLSKIDREICVIEEPAALISFPGALTYGHWIVDIAGRLKIVSDLLGEDQFRVLCPPYRPWMDRFFSLFNLPPESRIHLSEEIEYQCRQLVVPTIMGHLAGGTLPVAFLSPVFSKIRYQVCSWLNSSPALREYGPLLILHTPQTSASGPDRVIQNIDEVVGFVSNAAGRVVDPLRVHPYKLIDLIGRSAYVIGQDSSALHNLAFAHPKPLVVIESIPRGNLYHPSLQEMSSSSMSYFGASLVNGDWRVCIDALSAHLANMP